jgi:hypothetical protein
MKIVQILGGLGNQMFQYAFAIALKERFKDEVFIDTSTFETYPLHNGYELDKIFKISLKPASKQQISSLYHYFTNSYWMVRIYKHLFPKKQNEFRELEAKPFNSEVFERDGNNYYAGYWQDYRYCADYRSCIKKEFEYKELLDDRNNVFFEKLKTENYVSVHIRRGDYSKERGFGDVCTLQYYANAISYVKQQRSKMKFAFFSNDFRWVKNEIVPLVDGYEYVLCDWNQGKNSYIDMRLMSACETNILANSSFSWWAAFLNIHDTALVIAPEKWNIYQECKRQLPEWVLI